MPATLPKPTVAAIETALLAKANPDIHAIASIFNTTYTTVRRVQRRLNNFLATGIDPRKTGGRKPKIPEEEQTAEYLRGLLERQPDLHQKEIGEWLEREKGVKVCQPTISRLLLRYEIPHKRFKRPEQRRRKGGPLMSRGEVDRELAAAREQRRLKDEARESEESERLVLMRRQLEENMLASQAVGYNSPYL